MAPKATAAELMDMADSAPDLEAEADAVAPEAEAVALSLLIPVTEGIPETAGAEELEAAVGTAVPLAAAEGVPTTAKKKN
jgi:hypothetical protein